MPNQPIETRLQEAVEGLAGRPNVPHAVLSAETVDGTFAWSGAAGVADPEGTAPTPSTPFWIASVTKLFTATVVFQLVERGRLVLGESMTAYLPDAVTRGLHRIDGVDRSDAVTLRHLLTHASGLPDYLEDRPRDGGPSLLERVVDQGDVAWTIDDVVEIVRSDLEPHFPPQPLAAGKRRIRYSDTNYQLLIAIVESITGKPLPEVFAEAIYDRIGVSETWHPGTRGASDDAAVARVHQGSRPLDVPLAMRSFLDLNSTVGDLTAFLRALVRGHLFDDPATLAAMRSGWTAFPFSLNPAATSLTWPIAYGHGMMRMVMPRIFSPFRAVPSMEGHTGVSGSWLFHSPELDVIIAGTVDQMTAGAVPFRFVPKLLATLADELAPGAPGSRRMARPS